MYIKKCFGEITEQSGGEFKISTEKDNKKYKKAEKYYVGSISFFVVYNYRV